MQGETKNPYEKRNQLLKMCMEKGMSLDTISEIVRPMREKTDEEKENLAEQILNRISKE